MDFLVLASILSQVFKLVIFLMLFESDNPDYVGFRLFIKL